MKRLRAFIKTFLPLAFVLVAVFSVSHASTAEKYLFYLHGKIIEDQGIPRPRSEKFGYYEYEKILATFRNRGFTVRSEIRPAKTEVRAYAEKVAGEVHRLLQAGVPPGHITVVGASKGGVIAIITSALLHNRDVNFVFLACCYEAALKNLQDTGMQVAGNILSIYDSTDDTGCGSCQGFFTSALGKKLGSTKEIVLHMGLGHGILYRPLSEWVESVIAWVNDKGAARAQKLPREKN
jgi:hypothetical protein